MAKRAIRGSGSVVKVEGCEDIERILRDSEAIETIVKKCVSLVKKINEKNLDDPEGLKQIRVGLDAAKVVVDIHKFHVGVSTKTVESERMLDDTLDAEDDAALIAMIQTLENASGEKILTVEGVSVDGNGDETYSEAEGKEQGE